MSRFVTLVASVAGVRDTWLVCLPRPALLSYLIIVCNHFSFPICRSVISRRLADYSFVILTLDQPRHESQQSVVKYLQVISVDPFRILLAQPDHCIEMQRCANISYKYLGDIIWLARLSCPAPLDNVVRGII